MLKAIKILENQIVIKAQVRDRVRRIVKKRNECDIYLDIILIYSKYIS